MVLPSTGTLSFSQIQTEFGATYVKYSLFLGLSAGLPVTGPLSLSQLRGAYASTPSVSAISNQNVNTASTAQNLSINIGSYVSDTYGGTLSYSSPSFNSSYVSSASISGSTLSYSVPINKWANTTPITVVVTNKFGKTATLSIPLFITGYNISTSTPSSSSLTNNTATYSLSSYFTDYSGSGLSYSITSNPYSNASISSGTLSIVGNNRNTSYSVVVAATNGFGMSSSISVSITEASAAPYNDYWIWNVTTHVAFGFYNYKATQLYTGVRVYADQLLTVPSGKTQIHFSMDLYDVDPGAGYLIFGISTTSNTDIITVNTPAKPSGTTYSTGYFTSGNYNLATNSMYAGNTFKIWLALNPQTSVPWQEKNVLVHVYFT